MAYRLRPMILAVLSLLILPVASIVTAVEHFIFPAYQPDASTSLVLDSAAHALDTSETLRSRFRAFINRCL